MIPNGRLDSNLDHSASLPSSDRLLSFVQNIARFTLFAESDYVTDRPEGTDPEAVQTDLDWLIAQDETLESLVREARALTSISNHPPLPKELNPDGITLTDPAGGHRDEQFTRLAATITKLLPYAEQEQDSLHDLKDEEPHYASEYENCRHAVSYAYETLEFLHRVQNALQRASGQETIAREVGQLVEKVIP